MTGGRIRASSPTSRRTSTPAPRSTSTTSRSSPTRAARASPTSTSWTDFAAVRFRPVGELLDPVLRHQLPDHGDVVAVAGEVGADPAADRVAQEVEVADDVEDLVAHELVGKAELGV